MKQIEHWIDGKRVSSTSGRSGPVYDPATGEQQAEVGFASVEEVDDAVAAAERCVPCVAPGVAVAPYRDDVPVPAPARRAPRRDRGGACRRSTARCAADAAGELARGIENVEFACGIPALLKGGFTEQAATDVDVHSVRQPLGVVAGITPFNFPAMVPLWMLRDCDRVRQHVRAEAEREGPVARRCCSRSCSRRPACPTACSTSLHGDKVAVDRLLEHPDVAAISFVGSTPIARYVYETGTGARQAGAGARRRQEPHGRAARRRRRGCGRRRGLGCLRIGGRAVHGGVGRRGGRRRRPIRSSTRSRSGCPR